MVRSNWNAPLVVVLALLATANGQTSTPLPVTSTRPGDHLITVQELNRPAQVCRILRNWQMEDGTQAYQVQAVDTGEMMTITENGTLAAPPSAGRRVRAVATRIYHWGRSLNSPAGVPMPPGEVIVSTPAGFPAAVKLPPGETRVIMPTPPITVTVPTRNLPGERGEPVFAQAPPTLPAQIPVAEPLKPSVTHIVSPPMVTKLPPLKGESTPPIVRKQVPAVATSLQKKPAEVVEPGSSPYAERRWPSAFSGQQQVEAPTARPSVPVARQIEPVRPVARQIEPVRPVAPVQTAPVSEVAKSTATPIATPIGPENCNTPVYSTVAGPCAPKRRFFQRIFKRDSKDPCCQDACAISSTTPAAPGQVATVPATPSTTATQSATRPEPSKTLLPRTVAQTPTAPATSSDWRKSWGTVGPRKPEETIARTPASLPELIANTTPTTPRKPEVASTPPEPASTTTPGSKTPATASATPPAPKPSAIASTPAVPVIPKPVAQVASEPAKPPTQSADEKSPSGWHPFRHRKTKPANDKKAVETAAKPAKKVEPAATPAPASTVDDWKSPGKKDDVATRSTSVSGTAVHQPPAYLPETPLPHAHTEVAHDPLSRPSEYAKHPPVDLKVKTDVAKSPPAKTDVAKLTETKKPEAKAKKTEVAQAAMKESPQAKQASTATPASATNPVEPPPGSGSVLAAGSPQYIPVPIATVPSTLQQPMPPTPPEVPMPNIPQAPNPNQGQYTHPNPLTVPPHGYRNAFTNPGPENPVPAETIPPETSQNAFSAPEFEGKGTPPPAIPALMRNTPTISPGPIVPVPPGTPVGGIPMKGMPMQAPGMPIQGMPPRGMPPMQGMPMQQLPVPMQGMPMQQLPVPMRSNPMQQLPPMPVQPMGPGNQGAQAVPGVAWMPQQPFVPANYYHLPAASQVNVYTMPQTMAVGYQQPQQSDGQSNVALILQMLRDSDYPSQREWAAEQLASQNGRVSPAVVTALVTAAKEDPAAMVRVQCIRSLTRMQVQTLPVSSLLQQMQKDSDPRVRDAVSDAMTAMGTPGATKAGDVQPVSTPVMPKE